MRIRALLCAAAILAVPASAQSSERDIELLSGHPVYDEAAHEAGVVMAISITHDQDDATDLQALCEELRVAAGLERDHGGDLPLETIFVVPYKAMAIEGYYLPAHDAADHEALVRGSDVARDTLDDIVDRAGIPASLLDEIAVEHEISCAVHEPAWLIRWEDVRPINGDPDPVIESARQRFMTIHRSVVEHALVAGPAAALRAPDVVRPALALSDDALASGR